MHSVIRVETHMSMADTDLGLLERYRASGDQDAFAEIVRRYAAAVFSTAIRILGDRARADDVSQETFFRLSQKPDSVKQSLGGWLHTAATRLSIDIVRSESSRSERDQKYEPKPAAEVTQWSEISPLVDETLAEMPDDVRVLLVRHFLQGHNQCLLAGEMRTSPATVSRKIKAGVDELRRRLHKKGVVIATALLVSFMRDHGAQAAPVELMHQLGKITMLSGGKPATAPLAPACCAAKWWWIASMISLAAVFVALCVTAFPPPPASLGPDQTLESQRDDVQYYGDARLHKLKKAGLGE